MITVIDIDELKPGFETDLLVTKATNYFYSTNVTKRGFSPSTNMSDAFSAYRHCRPGLGAVIISSIEDFRTQVEIFLDYQNSVIGIDRSPVMALCKTILKATGRWSESVKK